MLFVPPVGSVGSVGSTSQTATDAPAAAAAASKRARCGGVFLRGLWDLDELDAAGPAVVGIKFEDRLGGRAGASEEVEHAGIGRPAQRNEVLDETHRLREIEDAAHAQRFLDVASAGAGHSKALAVENRTRTGAAALIVLRVDEAAAKDQVIVVLGDLVAAPAPARHLVATRGLVRPVLSAVRAYNGEVEGGQVAQRLRVEAHERVPPAFVFMVITRGFLGAHIEIEARVIEGLGVDEDVFVLDDGVARVILSGTGLLPDELAGEAFLAEDFVGDLAQVGHLVLADGDTDEP